MTSHDMVAAAIALALLLIIGLLAVLRAPVPDQLWGLTWTGVGYWLRGPAERRVNGYLNGKPKRRNDGPE